MTAIITVSCSGEQRMGKYFAKKTYVHQDLPVFLENKQNLPQPVLDGNKSWIDMYWKCWEIAFSGLKQPPAGSPFVSNWLDETFSENIFQWDTIFMMMFARYAHNVFPAIESLDNFYCRQRASGFIGREYREKDGRLIHFDFDGGLFSLTGFKNSINPPLFSWAEVESYKISGDKSRFEMVLPVLEKYSEWLNQKGDPEAADWESNGRKAAASHQLFWNTPLGSGMDNTPRPAQKGAGWVEMSSQMVIMYNNLAIICDELGKTDKAAAFYKEADAIGKRINKWCWMEEDGFYYDVLQDGSQFKKKTSGGFWPLLAGIATKEQAKKLVDHLEDPDEFWRKIPFPSLAADEAEYNEYGDYWLGGVWAPTNVMIIKGLENYSYDEFAAESAEKYLAGMYDVFKDSGTVYENYAPDHFAPGNRSKADFAGWTGCGPTQLLFENVMGIKPDANKQSITWILRRTDRHGVQQLKRGGNTVSVICEKRVAKEGTAILHVECNSPIKLNIIHPLQKMSFKLKSGKHILQIG